MTIASKSKMLMRALRWWPCRRSIRRIVLVRGRVSIFVSWSLWHISHGGNHRGIRSASLPTNGIRTLHWMRRRLMILRRMLRPD